MFFLDFCELRGTTLVDCRRNIVVSNQTLGLKTKSRAISVRDTCIFTSKGSALMLMILRLRDGRSIRTVSALLLQLVQTSAHNVRQEARRIAKARQQQFAMKRQDSASGDLSGPFLDDIDLEVCASQSFVGFS